jgi:D-arabinose 1-dehydrogenase-like Zn-dependent alcohol dehydrogenase
MQEGSKYIAGHEGAGHVVAVGEGMKHKWKVGDRAGVRLNDPCVQALLVPYATSVILNILTLD